MPDENSEPSLKELLESLSKRAPAPAPRPEVVFTPSAEVLRARKEELLAKVQQTYIAQILQGGRILEKDPNKEYRWVNTKDARQIVFKSLGWTRCHSPTPSDLPVTEHRTAEGLHIRGDTVLYEMSKDYYQALEYYKELRRIDNVDNAPLSFNDAATRSGVKTYKPNI